MARIQNLTADTISKIAAGEVIQKPSSALKELVENSLDAKSTQILVKLRDGGLSFLQIIDNGVGIHVEDFRILCHRFTTSKISLYEDLLRLNTFGFRGEALSSISYVSKLTVCSRRSGEPLGYKAEYIDGELIMDPSPYAYDKGTAIIVEDLFYNNPTKKKALSDHSELYNNCADIIAKYALQYCKVSFKLFRNDSIEFSSNGNGDRSEILKFWLASCKVDREIIEIPSVTADFCTFWGLISNTSYSSKQKFFILFVNGRLVESLELKNLISEVFSVFMPKSVSFFVYLSIEVPANEIDVNVHPCKQEVRFAKQAQIFAEVLSKIQEVLNAMNASRTLTIKAFELPKSSLAKKVAPPSQIRENATLPLEWFSIKSQKQSAKIASEKLVSVESLKEDIVVGKEQEIFDGFSYIGCAEKNTVFVQHQTSLYMLNCEKVLETLVYQWILDNFAEFGYLELGNRDFEIKKILEIALANEKLGYDPNKDPSAKELIENYAELLASKSEMLDEYFSICIENGILLKIPSLVDGLIWPDAKNLPEFILRLCTDVNWKKEKNCLGDISQLLSWFYSKVPDEWGSDDCKFSYESHYKNSLFPYLRGRIKADIRELGEGNGVIYVVNTESLYKVFERC